MVNPQESLDLLTNFQHTAMPYAAPTRNNGKVALLRKFFGMGADNGDTSEADLESWKTQEDNDAIKQREAAAMADAATNESIYARPGQQLKRKEDFDAKAILTNLEHQPTPAIAPLRPTPVRYTNPYAAPGAPGAPNRPGAPGPAGGSAPVNAAAPGATPGGPDRGAMIPGESPDARFNRITADLPPETRATIKAGLAYQEKIPDTSSAAAKFAPFLQEMLIIDPSFDVTKYDARQKLQSGITDSKGATNVKMQSLNRLAGHGLDNEDLQNKLNNSNFMAIGNKPVNAFEEWILGHGGAAHGNRTNYMKNNGLMDAEVANLLAPGQATDELRNRISNTGADSPFDDQTGTRDMTRDLAKRQYDAMLAEVGNMPRGEELQKMIESQLTPAARKFFRLNAAPGAAPGATPGGSDVVFAIDPTGTRHQAKRGTPLPAGWRME